MQTLASGLPGNTGRRVAASALATIALILTVAVGAGSPSIAPTAAGQSRHVRPVQPIELARGSNHARPVEPIELAVLVRGDMRGIGGPILRG